MLDSAPIVASPSACQDYPDQCGKTQDDLQENGLWENWPCYGVISSAPSSVLSVIFEHGSSHCGILSPTAPAGCAMLHRAVGDLRWLRFQPLHWSNQLDPSDLCHYWQIKMDSVTINGQNRGLLRRLPGHHRRTGTSPDRWPNTGHQQHGIPGLEPQANQYGEATVNLPEHPELPDVTSLSMERLPPSPHSAYVSQVSLNAGCNRKAVQPWWMNDDGIERVCFSVHLTRAIWLQALALVRGGSNLWILGDVVHQGSTTPSLMPRPSTLFGQVCVIQTRHLTDCL
ncbi:unnamed protein product [Pleuronectes platessa]|uniref:Uncharacterized protein n=1 Tax=Pleuronectes platessa TaxID=8262 RepID=A0A9N7YKG3_PLEPL|nr:unnamed protein product [Pleuronectes platessa]